jgi:hypothetical protein
MPVTLEAVFVSAPHGTYNTNIVDSFGSGWLQVSGVTANYPLVVKLSSTQLAVTTRGFGFSDADGKALLPFYAYDNYTWASAGEFNIILATTQGAVLEAFAQKRFGVSGGGQEHANIGNWSITQDAAKNVTAQITDYQTTATFSLFQRYDSGALEFPQYFKIWEVKMYAADGSLLHTNSLTPRPDGQQPFTVFPATSVTVTGEYFFTVARKYKIFQSGPIEHLEGSFATVLTAPVTSGGGGGGAATMFSWLNNDYWYLTDLQVNLGTRAVTHRHGTVEIRPNDTVNFAVLFHDGSAGVNPVATDLRLAVRSSSNNSAYYFWANPAVTTTSAGGNVFYTITVTASDEDLLAAQAVGLLAGSNATQTLLAEVQWTTTRGTFTSDTFNISVANEVAREPDV